MYMIYSRPGSGAVAVEIMLEEAGQTFRRIEVPRGQENVPAEMRRINPRGEVPVLVLPDGSTMTDSAAMMIYLADRHSETGLAPGPDAAERAAYLRWLAFVSANIYGTFMHIYHTENFSADPAAHDGIKTAAKATLQRDFATIEKALEPGPYLLGDRLSAADLYLLMFPYWDPNRSGLFERSPRLAGLCETLLQRPAVKRVWAYHEKAM